MRVPLALPPLIPRRLRTACSRSACPSPTRDSDDDEADDDDDGSESETHVFDGRKETESGGEKIPMQDYEQQSPTAAAAAGAPQLK